MIKETPKAFGFVWLWLLATLAACSSDEPATLPTEEVQIVVILEEGESNTRATLDGKNFEPNDKFRFFFNSDKPTGSHADPIDITGGDSDPKKTDYNTTDGKKWTSDNPIYWDDYAKIEERKFSAIMPFNANYNSTDNTFEVATNQTTESYVKENDLLLARVQTNKRLIPLHFWHVLSRVIVNITASTDANKPDSFTADELKSITLDLNNILPTANITYNAIGAQDTKYLPYVTVSGQGTVTDINMHSTTAGVKVNAQEQTVTASFVAIVPPQTISNGTQVLTIKTTDKNGNNKNYYFTHTTDIIYGQSKQTTINLTLKKTQVIIDDATITIHDWGTKTANNPNGPIVLLNKARKL